MSAHLKQLERRLAELEREVARIGRLTRPAFGTTSEELLARTSLRPDRQWSDEDWADLMSVSGIFDGPDDLSERLREYLRGECP